MQKLIIIQSSAVDQIEGFILAVKDHWTKLTGNSSKGFTDSFGGIVDKLLLCSFDEFVVSESISTDKALVVIFTFNFSLFYRRLALAATDNNLLVHEKVPFEV